MAMLLYKGNLITVACTRKKDQRLWESTVDAVGVMMADQLLDFLLRSPSKVFDFTLGTHPISTKGTTELGRSEATKRF
jgi:hypothetical protein